MCENQTCAPLQGLRKSTFGCYQKDCEDRAGDAAETGKTEGDDFGIYRLDCHSAGDRVVHYYFRTTSLHHSLEFDGEHPAHWGPRVRGPHAAGPNNQLERQADSLP